MPHRLPLLLGALVGLALFPVPATSVASAGETYVPGEVVIGFASDSGRQQRVAAVSAADPEGTRAVPGIPGVRVVELGDGESVARAVRELGRRDGVAFAEPNFLLRLAALPNDPYLGFLWGLRNVGQNTQLVASGDPVFGVRGIDIGAAAAWRLTTGGAGRGTRVAIVDSGVDPTHPDLAPNLNRELSRNFTRPPGAPADAAPDPSDWIDDHGHGTHVAGTVGAVGDNGLGVTGVNWRADLVSVRVCVPSGLCPSTAVAAGLAYAGRIGAPVANVSLTGDDEAPGESELMRRAIADSPRTLFVIAAGNGDDMGIGFDVDRKPEYPCAFDLPNIICVAAIDSRGNRTEFSNWGAASVDVGAPGQAIQSTYVPRYEPFSDYFESGTGRWLQAPYPWVIQEDAEGEPRLTFDGHDGGVEVPVAEATAVIDDRFDLTDKRSCRATFSLALALHGDQTFESIYSVGGGPWEAVPGRAFTATDSTGDRELEVTALPGPADGRDDVRFGFRFRANGSPTPVPTVRIGPVEMMCLEPNPPGGAYAALTGTSMAAPHVAGIAALARSVATDVSTARLKHAIMSTAIPVDDLKGRTVTGGRASAAGAVRNLKRHVRPRLGLKVRPRSSKVRAGGRRVLRVVAWNRGRTAARRLTVCLRLEGRGVRAARCSKGRSLRPGRRLVIRFPVRAAPRGVGRVPRLVFRATARDADPATTVARVRVVR